MRVSLNWEPGLDFRETGQMIEKIDRVECCLESASTRRPKILLRYAISRPRNLETGRDGTGRTNHTSVRKRCSYRWPPRSSPQPWHRQKQSVDLVQKMEIIHQDGGVPPTYLPQHHQPQRSTQGGSAPHVIEHSNEHDEEVYPVMDTNLWSHLPEHLMERILTYLSISALFRLCSVCKAWHALAFSPTFLHLYARNRSSQQPWFFMFRNQDYREASTFNPTMNRWVNVAPPNLSPNQMFFPIASAGGLVCLSSCANGRTTLVVANPITRQWRELPPMLRIQTYHMAGMVVDGQTKAYKIVVVGIYGIYDVYYPTTEVFMSGTNEWTLSGDIPRGPLFPSRRTLLCNDILYSWCCDPPDGLVAYSMEDGMWTQIHAPMRHSLDSHMLIECMGRIYTVGGLRENSVTKSICVWELLRAELEWKEVDRMPEGLCDEFLCGGRRFICIGSNGLVLLIVRGRSRLVLSYDLREKVWRRLPGCPLADHRLRYGLIDGIAFEPRLDASV